MLQLFSGPGPIYALIDEYAEWKYGIHPYQAGAYRSLLIRFCKTLNIRDISEITEDNIAYFIGGELSAFYARHAQKAFRSFLVYAGMAGYPCVSHEVIQNLSLRTENSQGRVEARERIPSWRLGLKWKRN